jgi:hypothetical protein
VGDETTKDVAVLQAEMRDVRDDIKEIKDDVRELLKFTQEARGSWKTVVAISGAAAAMGALVAKIVPHIPFR